MTAEEAFWHASTNTPIDQPRRPVQIPEVISNFYDAAHDEHVYVFRDGAIIKLYPEDVLKVRRQRELLRDIVAQRYLEQRGDKL